MMLAIGAELAAATPSSAHAWDVYAKPQRLVALPDGRRANIHCTGAGAPTIVLEAGLGFPNLSWRKVQPLLAARNRVCAYDRAGIGFSDPGPAPRTPARLATELRALMRAAAEPPPYVVVGSSFGGMVARAFAVRYRADTAGVVLVDPAYPGQTAILARAAPSMIAENRRFADLERACLKRLEGGSMTRAVALSENCVEAPDASYPEAVQEALWRQRLSPTGARTTFEEGQALDRARYEPADFGDLPLVVLTAKRAFEGSDHDAAMQARLIATWRELHRRLAAESTRGVGRLVDSGHVIQSTDPQAVVAAVGEVLSAARP